MRITDLQINHLTTPLGFSLEEPRLSWRYDGLDEGDGTRAAAARITVARTREDLLDPSGDQLLEDTGWQTDLDPRATPLALALDWRSRYWWRVQVRTDTGRVVTSDPTWFETGVMEDEWASRWITTGVEDAADDRLPIFSARLRLQNPVDQIERARLYVSALGRQKVLVNGREVDQGYMDPSDQTTDAWLQADTYDITRQLKEPFIGEDGAPADGQADVSVTGAAGKPAATSARRPIAKPVNKPATKPRVQILVGDGFYRSGRSGRFDPHERPWNLIAEVHIWYTDGSHQTIGTDESWQVTRSHVVVDPLTGAETRDDTLPDEVSVPARIDQRNHALLYDRLTPPVEQRPLTDDGTVRRTVVSGVPAVDLGRVISGTFRFRSDLPQGAGLLVLLATTKEGLGKAIAAVSSASASASDGIDARTALSVIPGVSTYRYVSDGAEKQVSPAFAAYGYRWLAIVADPATASAPLDGPRESLTPIELSESVSSATPILRVEIGDEGDSQAAGSRVQKFLGSAAAVSRVIRQAQHAIDDDILTDPASAPARGERRHWTGDAQALVASVLRSRDTAALYDSYLFELRAVQERLHGRVPVAAPNSGEGIGTLVSPGFSDAAVLLLWALYRASGDEAYLRRNEPLMIAWADWTQKHADQLASGTTLGDWLAHDDPQAGPAGVRGATPSVFLAAVCRLLMLETLARAERVMARRDASHLSDAEKYGHQADEVRSGLLADWFDDAGLCTAGTQTGLIASLALDLGDRGRTVDALSDSLEEACLVAGFVGQSLLPLALEKADEAADSARDGQTAAVRASVDRLWDAVWKVWVPVGTDSDDSDSSLDPLASLHLHPLPRYVLLDAFLRHYAGIAPGGDDQDQNTGDETGQDSATNPGDMAGSTGGNTTDDDARTVLIRPRLSRRMGRLYARLRLPGGVWRISWRILGDDRVRVRVVVPFDATAELTLPACGESGPRRLGPGLHVYEYEAKEPIAD